MNNEQIRKILTNEQNLSNDEVAELTWLVNQHLYRERPVTIQEFCASDDFVHKKWPNIYPLWQDTLAELYPTPFNAPYNEVLISAAAGGGKTTTATIGVLYDMYKLGCLIDPCQYYGLTPDTMLIFAVFSATGSTAAVNWQDITTGIEKCPWMMEKLVDKRGLDKKNGSLVPVEILPGIFIQTGSKFQHSMGKAIFDGLMDEAAFGGNNLKEAQKTYNELSSRMATRFRSFSKKGFLPGHLFLISSPKEAGDFMQYRIDLAEKNHSKLTLIKKNISSWDANPNNDSDDKFTVFVGSETKEPKIYEPDEMPDIEDMEYLIYPPMSYYENFKTDLLGSIMNYGGIATISDMGLFKSQTALRDAFVMNNPFEEAVIKLPFSRDNKQVMDFCDLNYFRNIRHPEYNRFLHIDAAYSADSIDVYGLAAGYCVPVEDDIYANIDPLNPMDGDSYVKNDRMYFIDFCVGFAPCDNEEVPLSKIQDFIIYLIKEMKYPVACISADQFQSKQTLQNFEMEGFNTAYISVDRTRDPYLFLRSLINNRKIIITKNERALRELSKLRDDGQKIDHPVGCFTGDTKIKLADGTFITMKELAEKGPENEFYVYACKDGKIIPAKAYNAHKTKTDKIVRVRFMDDTEVRCTYDHKFMLKDGTYKEIQHINNDELMQNAIKYVLFTDNEEDVYDITVPDYHNFVLFNNVVVHNSTKDIADAIAGCIWNCSNSKDIVSRTRIARQILNHGMIPDANYSPEQMRAIEQQQLNKMRQQFSTGIFKGL